MVILVYLQDILQLMNVFFTDDALRELYETGRTKDGRYKKLARNQRFIDAYIQVINLMLSTEVTSDLKMFSYLHYEQLNTVRRVRSE